MMMTLLKPEGAGWLIVLETVIEGKYKIVQERLPKEPQYDLIIVIMRRLTKRLDNGGAITCLIPTWN
ncbi:hypothetical protein ACQCN2_09190 [Brevibacillus ginsengisoli]|uniref:hypothetical protein n=1 Tax=Brevibacillus ginsengisoli TaxID=363854 RepID=UPI003CF1927E